jgi:hypothetical protein
MTITRLSELYLGKTPSKPATPTRLPWGACGPCGLGRRGVNFCLHGLSPPGAREMRAGLFLSQYRAV